MVGLLLKLVYSALLLGIVGVAARELWTVWLDTRVYIGAFDVVSESGNDDSASQAFPERIVAAQTILSQQVIDYQSRHGGDAPSDPTYAIPGMAALSLPPEALAGVDITVQNINLRQILTAVRRGFLAPNEVSGRVTVRPGSVLAAVDWPQAPSLADGGSALTKFLAPSRVSAQEVAAYIACSISWARAASSDAKFAAFSRAQFCDFAAALADLYALEEAASTADGLDDKSIQRIRKHAATLRSYYEAKHVFPGVYRLRADLLELLPENKRTKEELIEAQEARVLYAMSSSELHALPEEEKRMAALALARPAILLDNTGNPKDPPENWADMLKRRTAEIGAAALSTGLIIGSDGNAVATGFIVAPGVMMTARYVIDAALGPPNAEVSPPAKPPKLCLGPSKDNCTALLELGEVLYPKKNEESRLVLVELRGHDPDLQPPLSLADSLPASNEVVGSYVYMIGYLFHDRHTPEDFVKRLLGEAEGQRRLMPGRVLAFGNVARIESDGNTVFTTDISTTSGAGGGPLIDLKTGKVIGVSYADVWKGERGKFAYADPIPRAALDIISQRTRGALDSQGSPAPPGKQPGN
jgi:Trypsin-like peptidase domain